MSTYIAKEADIEKKWHLIDAEGKVLGRVAVEAAKLIRGKHKASFSPHQDCGDHVVIINAAKAIVSGAKYEDKIYYRHSGYPGGLTEVNFREMMEKHPTRPMEMAVKGMLPHNRLGRKLATNFRVYPGPEHEQQAQNPQPYEV